MLKAFVFVLVLTFSSFDVAQSTGSNAAGQSANAPDPQTVQENSTNPPNSSAMSQSDGQSDTALQSRIEDAIRNEPTLGNSHISVAVSEGRIDLAGTVGSSKDKETAERMAQSFDGNRKVNDKLAITGHGHSDLAPDHSAMNNGGTGNAPNPAMNPDTNSTANTPPRK